MLKLRFSEPHRKQYLDGKISLCKYDCTILDNSTKQVVHKFSVTGTAKCSPNDEVNSEFGMKLADSRAKLNAYKAAAKLVDEKTIEGWVDRINKELAYIEFVDQMRYLKKKEFLYIEEVCSEV